MKRKALTLLLCLSILVGMFTLSTIAATDNPFVDVDSNAYYFEPVLWAVEQGITTGTSENSFSPLDVCTRAQVVTFLWRAAGKPEPVKTDNPFTDVPADVYYYKAVLWAVEKGITTGTAPMAFSPEDPCTRAQVVTFLYRAAGNPAPTRSENPFDDVSEGIYYYNPILWAVEMGITNGTSPTAFDPEETCIRAQIVTFLYRYMAKNAFKVVAQPVDYQMTSSDGTASFTVEVAGGTAPYEYQWVLCRGSELFWQEPVTSDETTDTFTAHITDYDFDNCDSISVFCMITDARGSAIKSRSAEILQYVPLRIVSQPEDYQILGAEDVASFTVEIAGGIAPYEYQWYVCYDSGTLTPDPVSSGSTSNIFTWEVTEDELNFYDSISVYCVITDAGGKSIQSARADVLHREPLSIVSHPEACQLHPGEKIAYFTVEVSGGIAPYEYQWYVYYDNICVPQEPVSTSERSNTLSCHFSQGELDYCDSIWVYCIITDATGATVESYNAYLLL